MEETKYEKKTYVCDMCKKQKTDDDWYPVEFDKKYNVCIECILDYFYDNVHPDYFDT